MNSAISEGILVNIEVSYQPEYSNPMQNEFMFAYRATIENFNFFPVKLLHRNWYIFDSNGSCHQIEGEGVVGVQPILQAGDEFQYVSGCTLRTDIGKMKGYYQMENLDDHSLFRVLIPEFLLIVPAKEN
jgi:ApaG protein